MGFDEELDALGLLCPLPVLRAAKRLRAMSPGSILRLIVDDPAAAVDVPHFCKEQGHELLNSEKQGSLQIYTIRKSGSAAKS